MLASVIAPFVASYLIASAEAAVVAPASWSASSSAPASDDVSYDIKQISDLKQSSPWVEGDAGSGLGSWALADFGGEKVVNGFTVWAGVWYTYEYWGRYNRPKLLLVEFSDGTTEEVTLTDEMKPQTINFKAPKKTSQVKIKVKGVYNGNTFNDTGISEVVFFDGAAPPAAPVKAYKASSTFPADGDGNYDAPNVSDGILDSMWCEGNKTGDGTNESLELDFGSSKSVSQLLLRNGNAYSFGYFMKGNRALAATLTFSDGSTESVTIKDSISEQKIAFPQRSTSKVKIVFTSVKKGSEYNDLCISEAAFLP